MTTLAQTVTTVQFDTALRQMADRARTRYAGEAARIDRGLVIALNGGVTLKADGVALVSSTRDDEVFYIVREGQCDCPDFSRAPGGRCKHRFAVCLVKKAQGLVAEQQAAHTYYATYDAEHATYQGTAQYLPGQGWVFRSDADDFTVAYADHASLVLGGRVDLLEAQRVADETAPGHVARICGYTH
jgi:SWIM zinc finger